LFFLTFAFTASNSDVEFNKLGTFKYPFYYFLGDLKMLSELLLRKRKFEESLRC
tara:strand:- start:193 stop:354 length:162 start_codon:yes stop_codon:yes gene_type:complete